MVFVQTSASLARAVASLARAVTSLARAVLQPSGNFSNKQISRLNFKKNWFFDQAFSTKAFLLKPSGYQASPPGL